MQTRTPTSRDAQGQVELPCQRPFLSQGILSPGSGWYSALWVSWEAPCSLGLGNLKDAGNEHLAIATGFRRLLGEEWKLTWADQVSKSSSRQSSHHTQEYMHTQGDMRRPLLFVWALSDLLRPVSTWMPPGCPCAYWVYRADFATGGMESQHPSFHQVSKFSSPLRSCNDSGIHTENIAIFCYMDYNSMRC